MLAALFSWLRRPVRAELVDERLPAPQMDPHWGGTAPGGLAPADDGPDPDNAARAVAAAAKPERRPEDHPNAGRHERLAARIPATPAPLPVADGCPGCAGRDRVIRELHGERAQLRGKLARHELAATREQQLRPVTEQLP